MLCFGHRREVRYGCKKSKGCSQAVDRRNDGSFGTECEEVPELNRDECGKKTVPT